ncbi:amidohydrolase [Chlorobaculum parvum NCIB 8327]|uniref:Amidohydrolase n=1 Tax=Chlorobaculum parvum (strain DSM 263 / NCIMB 8327) TaxID=517417 RepID=B3QN87_CHLP8|nr:M20 family metallopeptidase [Chlorobaculum parvum]ACF11390.1 amidohydrolase [Chlorobaculum parvum NCIB 8327]
MQNDELSILATRVREAAQRLYPDIAAVRRHLHMHPELSYQEFRTTAFIKEYLAKLGIEPEPQLLETGVVAVLRGTGAPESKERKTVALRADIDALPLQEENSHDFCSTEAGCMHACGHDMHTAMLLGAASVLSDMKDELNGDVLLIFQPAEEKAPGGAKPMIDAGLLKRYQPSAIFAQHCFSSVQSGSVAMCKGGFMAAADELYITVHGQGGHASSPHKTRDPILASAHIITALQHLVSRVAPPHEPAVLSIASINGGHATNIIPGKVTMQGTMRTMNEELRSLLHERFEKTVKQVAEAFEVEADVEIRFGYPVLYNDPDMTDLAWEAAKEYLGDENVHPSAPLMTAEDFAYYLRECPGSFWQLGTGLADDKPGNLLHSPTFNPDEHSLETGVGMMSYLALRYLR